MQVFEHQESRRLPSEVREDVAEDPQHRESAFPWVDDREWPEARQILQFSQDLRMHRTKTFGYRSEAFGWPGRIRLALDDMVRKFTTDAGGVSIA